MVNLPYEVVEDLLCRLPVKPLKRFRCVAKSWRSLIDSERFVKLHWKRSWETMSHRHLFVLDNKNVFDVNLDGSDRVSGKASVIKLPFTDRVDGILSFGSGLFVVSKNTIFIWNPFTKECKRIPEMEYHGFPAPFGCFAKIVCGFCWDSRNNDYKVLWVVEHRDSIHLNWVASRAYIYGLKSNSWRQTVKINYSVENWQAEVNGAFHTLLYDSTPAKIMAFSVVDERQYEVKLPSGVDTGKGEVLRMKLHKLGGCLSMSYTYKSGIDIWVMKEYGARNSWSKLLSIPKKLTKADLDDNQIKPLAYTKDGLKVLLLLGYKTFFWQDLGNQTIDIVSVKGLSREFINVETCVESLISFHGEQIRKEVHDKEKDKKIRKKRDVFLSTGFKLQL